MISLTEVSSGVHGGTTRGTRRLALRHAPQALRALLPHNTRDDSDQERADDHEQDNRSDQSRPADLRHTTSFFSYGQASVTEL